MCQIQNVSLVMSGGGGRDREWHFRNLWHHTALAGERPLANTWSPSLSPSKNGFKLVIINVSWKLGEVPAAAGHHLA